MADLTRPIIGIENRTAQEVFDIMCDRFRRASPSQVAPQPQAGEPVSVWISELDLQFIREGRFREANVFNYEDEHRVPLYASPQPANPAQVTGFDAIELDIIRHGDMLGSELGERVYAALAAIGAGGQAVAAEAETLKARAASVLCEAGALCGWPAPNCNAREGAEALFKAGLLALSQPHPADERVVEALETYYARQIEWSKQTFGPAKRTNGILAHIRKELAEIAAKPDDLSEWVDVVILAMDGFWRHGGGASDLMPALLAKQQKNMARTWPDWRTMSEDSAIEHDRSSEASISVKEGR